MKIDWLSLLVVAVVSIIATFVFAVFLSMAIRLMSVARVATDEGRSAVGARVGSWVFLSLIGVVILFALYLIIPQFH